MNIVRSPASGRTSASILPFHRTSLEGIPEMVRLCDDAARRLRRVLTPSQQAGMIQLLNALETLATERPVLYYAAVQLAHRLATRHRSKHAAEAEAQS